MSTVGQAAVGHLLGEVTRRNTRKGCVGASCTAMNSENLQYDGRDHYARPPSPDSVGLS